MDYINVYFEDEVAAIGSGYRAVLVVARGPKFTKLLAPESCVVSELPTPVFERLLKRSKAIIFLEKDMRNRLKRVAADYDRYSATVRDALVELGEPPENLQLLPGEEQLTLAKTNDKPVKVKKVKPPALPAELPPDDGSEPKPMEGEGSGKFIQRVWMLGLYNPAQIVQLVLKNWEGRTTKVSDVKYNYNILLNKQTPNLPPWPENK